MKILSIENIETSTVPLTSNSWLLVREALASSRQGGLAERLLFKSRCWSLIDTGLNVI